jgi:hypothetical protein
MSDVPTEKPEDKDLQDHTFGRTVAAKAEEAERGQGDDEERVEHHAGGKA